MKETLIEFKEFLFSYKDIHWPGIKTYLDWQFYSDTALAIKSPGMALGVIFFTLLIIFGILTNIIYGRRMKRYPYYKRLKWHLTNMSFWIGIAGLFLILCRYQGIYFFSTRLVMTALMTILVIWIMWLLVYCIFKLRKEKKKFKEKEKLEKYLPKAKKRFKN